MYFKYSLSQGTKQREVPDSLVECKCTALIRHVIGSSPALKEEEEGTTICI